MVHLTLSNYQSRTHFLFYITHFMVIHSYIILILQLRDTITELYVALQAVFQQLLHTEDISLRYCGYYRDFLERELLQTEEILNQGFKIVNIKVITSKVLRSPP